jgi:hypothetical protein
LSNIWKRVLPRFLCLAAFEDMPRIELPRNRRTLLLEFEHGT